MPPVPQRPVHPASSPAEAIAKGYFAQVRFLLEMPSSGSGRGRADSRDPASGRTPLILCALIRDPGWRLSLARTLLEKGARVGLKDSRCGLNALHYACAHGRDQLTELYLQAIDYRVDDTDCYRNTAMHYAVRSGRPAIVEALLSVLSRFQLPVSLPNREGVTPLMLAYMGGHLGIARRLLAAGADADAVDAFGKATGVYEREAVERQRADADASEAKAAGRRLRFDDIDGWRRYQTRLRSAPPGRGRVSGGRSVASAFKLAQQEQRRGRMYQPEEASLISAASPLDRRNDPAEVFRASPADVFGPTSPSRQHQHHLLSVNGVGVASSRPRARSAMPLGRQGRQQQRRDKGDSDDSDSSDRSRDSHQMKLLVRAVSRCGGDSGGGGGGDSAMMASLFRNYEYHCSALYRPPPRVPDPALYTQDFAGRFLTPPLAADADGGSDSTPAGAGGRRGRKEAAGRKGKRGPAAAVNAALAVEAVRKKAGGGRISRAAVGRDD